MDLVEIDKITEKIIGCAMKVSDTLGVGFLEKVYENSLAVELRRVGLRVEQQKAVSVFYEGVLVGSYIADLFVADTVLVELKSEKALDDSHQAQMLNYLRATHLKIGLVINFGTSKIGIKPGHPQLTYLLLIGVHLCSSVFIRIHLWPNQNALWKFAKL